MDALLSNEPIIYAFLYFGVLGVVAVWEGLAPRRVLTAPLRTRWLSPLRRTRSGFSPSERRADGRG